MTDTLRSRTDDPDDPPEPPAGFTPPAVDPVPIGRKTGFEEIFGGRDTGAVGFHFPERDQVYLSPRANHHNGMLRALERNGVSVETRLVPFIVDTHPVYDDGEIAGVGAEFEYPRSAGGAYQYYTRNLRDTGAELVQQASQGVTVGDVYAAVYAVRLLDTPNRTDATISYLPPDLTSTMRAALDDDQRITTPTQRMQMADLYRELRFIDQLPRPIVSRRTVYDL